MKPGFDRIGIVGLGLMGGSIAWALRRLPKAPRVVAFTRDREEAVRALEGGAIDAFTETPDEAVYGQHLVLYATPLGAMKDLMSEHRDLWGDATVTDVAGLKAPLLGCARGDEYAFRYVGSHPMAGRAESGFAAATPDLFVDEVVWVIRGDATPDRAAAVESLWTSIGGRVRTIEADAHDHLMAWVSHVPQMLATVLARTLEGQGLRASDLGPGGRDMTRLAGSAPELWSDLFTANRELDLRALETLREELETMTAALTAGSYQDIAEMMSGTRRWRRDREEN